MYLRGIHVIPIAVFVLPASANIPGMGGPPPHAIFFWLQRPFLSFWCVGVFCNRIFLLYRCRWRRCCGTWCMECSPWLSIAADAAAAGDWLGFTTFGFVTIGRWRAIGHGFSFAGGGCILGRFVGYRRLLASRDLVASKAKRRFLYVFCAVFAPKMA